MNVYEKIILNRLLIKNIGTRGTQNGEKQPNPTSNQEPENIRNIFKEFHIERLSSPPAINAPFLNHNITNRMGIRIKGIVFKYLLFLYTIPVPTIIYNYV